jgi:hypothetical protein
MRLAGFRAIAALLVSCGGAGVVHAAPVSASLGYTVDQDGGYALDADVTLEATRHLSLHAGAGLSSGSEETSDLSGNLFDVGASLRGEAAGASLNYHRFEDGSNYTAGTLAARAWLGAGDFEFALLARRRDIAVNVTLELPLRTVRRELEFAGNGVGLEVGYSRENAHVYVMGLVYDYDAGFDDFLARIRSPQLTLRPRVEALVGSIVTQTQGAVDRQAGLGCEFGSGRHAFGVDLAHAHDAVLDASSTSLALTYRQASSARFDWAVSAGMIDSDSYGRTGFAGIQIGLAN